jgi:hypothetical protein
MFLKQRQATLEKYTKILVKVDNYQKSVYTTWRMSYELLSTRAQRLLGLMAFMHHGNITEDIFRRAAINAQPGIPSSSDKLEACQYVKDILQSYIDSAGVWDSDTFLTAMTELTSYSLISYDRANCVYALHVLVHDWASTVIAHSLAIAVEQTAFLLAVSISYGGTAEEYSFKRSLEVHISRLLGQQRQVNANNAGLFAEVYACTGQWSRKESLEVLVVDAFNRVLGHEHPDTLTSMNNLASTYQSQERFEQAEMLKVQVLDVTKRVLSEEHPETLKSMNNLGSTYWRQSRLEQVKLLEVQVVDVQKRLLGSKHPNTLLAMHNLLAIYQSMGAQRQQHHEDLKA